MELCGSELRPVQDPAGHRVSWVQFSPPPLLPSASAHEELRFWKAGPLAGLAHPLSRENGGLRFPLLSSGTGMFVTSGRASHLPAPHGQAASRLRSVFLFPNPNYHENRDTAKPHRHEQHCIASWTGLENSTVDPARCTHGARGGNRAAHNRNARL